MGRVADHTCLDSYGRSTIAVTSISRSGAPSLSGLHRDAASFRLLTATPAAGLANSRRAAAI